MRGAGRVWVRGGTAGLGLCSAPWPGRAVRWGRRVVGGEVRFPAFPFLLSPGLGRCRLTLSPPFCPAALSGGSG